MLTLLTPNTSSKMQIVPGQNVDLRLPRRASEEDDLLLEFWIPERTMPQQIFPRAARFYKWGYYGGTYIKWLYNDKWVTGVKKNLTYRAYDPWITGFRCTNWKPSQLCSERNLINPFHITVPLVGVTKEKMNPIQFWH